MEFAFDQTERSLQFQELVDGDSAFPMSCTFQLDRRAYAGAIDVADVGSGPRDDCPAHRPCR